MGGELPIRIDAGSAVVTEILLGGQTFLWEQIGEASWQGVHANHAYKITLRGGSLHWSSLKGRDPVAEKEIMRFFAVQTNFQKLAEDLPFRTDQVLRNAIQAFPGLRVLRQEIEPTLLSFLLSPLKRIDQIRAGLMKICQNWGTELTEGLNAPPSWQTLSTVSEDQLRTCGIGYRAKSVHKTSQFLSENPNYLVTLEKKSTEEARSLLLALPGVGRKIADCVLLFGLGRLEAFPIDTWIGRRLREDYDLNGYTDDQLQSFAKAHFGPAAGYAQQFLFASAKKG